MSWQEVFIKIMAILSLLLSSLGLSPRNVESPPPTSPPPSQTARPTAEVRNGYVIEAGTASYVDAKYGDDYLALPHSPRGTLVRICGDAGCVERRSTDVGPVHSLHRVADLSASDFVKVSGLPLSRGLCVVTVEYVGEQ